MFNIRSLVAGTAIAFAAASTLSAQTSADSARARELRHDPARMERVRVHAGRAEAFLEAHREEHVRRLRLPVSPPLVVRSPLELYVVEDDGR